MRRVGEAAKDDTIQMMSTAEARDQAVEEPIRDMGAASSASSWHARWATWQEFHAAMLGDEVPAPPLTTDKVYKVAAVFKAGGLPQPGTTPARPRRRTACRATRRPSSWQSLRRR